MDLDVSDGDGQTQADETKWRDLLGADPGEIVKTGRPRMAVELRKAKVEGNQRAVCTSSHRVLAIVSLRCL